MDGAFQGFTASELMTVWEQGNALDPVGRGVLLLVHATDLSPEEAALVDLGRRDQSLLGLRSATFGHWLETFHQCGRCGEPLEFSLDARQLLRVSAEEARQTVMTQKDGWAMRLPDSTDLAAAGRCRSVDEARRLLFVRCVTAGSDALQAPSEAMLERFSAWLAEVSPEMDIQLEVDCPVCAEHGSIAFDIVGFFWREIESACGRLVREVDALARTYGWSESLILGMTVARRRLYLDAVTS